MRRLLLPLVALAFLAPLGAASAGPCANPEEGEPRCCPPQYLVEIDSPPFYVVVHSPLAPDCY